MIERFLVRTFLQILFALVLGVFLEGHFSHLTILAIALAANLLFALLMVFLIPIPEKA